MLDGESYAQVALDADGGEEEGAVVDGHVEDKTRDGAESVGQLPLHVVVGLLHLEGQKQQEEEVRDGQVEEEDVDRCGFPPHLLQEGVEGQDICWEAQHKGNDVDRKAQAGVTLLHVGFGVNLSELSGIETCHIMSLVLTLEMNRLPAKGSLICQAV